MNKIILLVICCFFHYSIFAQKIITGYVKSNQGKPIAYTNIGIKGSKTGTISDAEGKFTLKLIDSLFNDTLTFSNIGFNEGKYPIQELISTNELNMVLTEKINLLKEVRISNRKRKTYRLGIKGRTPMIYMPASSYQKDDIIEQARLMHVKEPIQILNANIFILSNIKPGVKVRINFYSFKNGLPGERIVEKSIIRTLEQKKGWQHFDLTKEMIYLDKDFVIAFEFLPGVENKIAFAAKIGAADSYLRNNSLGTWRKNTIGGCTIYVTVQN